MKKRTNLPLLLGAMGMLVIIFDGKTAAAGVLAGIELCLHTLIPSLFPFFVLSTLITGSLVGQSIRMFRKVCKFCRMPEGTESLLIVGLLGGYPVGAGNIAAELKRGTLCVEDAQRLAVFCNNAGPSFLFGILSPLFPNTSYAWLLWAIQIWASVLTGFYLPGSCSNPIKIHHPQPITLPDSLNRGIKNMALVCGWVILFRMILEFICGYGLNTAPKTVQIAVAGILELSNGCIALSGIEDDSLRFLFAGMFLSLGGICVWMQTMAVFPELDLLQYIKGRMLHCVFCLTLSLPTVSFLSGNLSGFVIFAILSVGYIPFSFLLFRRKSKKEVAFYRSMMYNGS